MTLYDITMDGVVVRDTHSDVTVSTDMLVWVLLCSLIMVGWGVGGTAITSVECLEKLTPLWKGLNKTAPCPQEVSKFV